MFLITGNGCSGSKWMSEFFTQLGFPCTHEVWFKYPHPQMMQGSESSWMAAPHIPDIDSSVPVIRLVRNPLLNVRSIYSTRFLSDHPLTQHHEYVRKYRRDIPLDGDHLDRVINYSLLWDATATTWRAPFTFRIEDTRSLDKLSAVVQFATNQLVNRSIIQRVATNIPLNINSHNRGAQLDWITWDVIKKHKNGKKLYRRARDLNYV